MEGAPVDRIALSGIRAFGYHGALPAEREQGQPFVIDVGLGVDTRPAATADDLALTVDYGTIATRIVKAVEKDPVDLLETLAHRLAELCLAEPRVAEVEITVHKPHAPAGVPVDDVAVTIHRSRPR